MWVVLIIIFAVMTVNYEREREAAPTPPSSLVPSLERRAPDLADDRKVNEVDCTKPVDLSSGNLRCK
jgi:hypothetical protein